MAPETLAPSAHARAWTPTDPAGSLRAPPDAWQAGERTLPSEQQVYDLAALIDVALRDNPETRAAWEAARQAAAAYGRSLASFYPTVSAEAGMRTQ